MGFGGWLNAVARSVGYLRRQPRFSAVPSTEQPLVPYWKKHEGERFFLLGNGPSVRHEDLERMRDGRCFAANRFHLAYPQLAMRPDYTACIDLLVLEHHGSSIAEACETPLFIARRGKNSAELQLAYPHIVSIHEPGPFRHSPKPEDFTFSTDLTQGMGFGFGVVYAMMQIAVWMGAKELVLYGIDHNFVLPEQKTDDGKVLYQGEQNHFIPNYRNMGEKWAPPNPSSIEAAFMRARLACEAQGVAVWNATRGGKLEVFERRSIDDFLSHPA